MKKLFLLFFLFSFLFIPKRAFANANFKTAYDVTYTILETGVTNVTFKVTLTNATSQYFASSYKVKVGFSSIENIKASDAKGQIKPVVSKVEDGQSIELTFNKKAAGINQKLSFTLSFDTNEVAQKLGEVWEVNIPGIANQEAFEHFSVHVKIPSVFGSPTFIKPPPKANTLDFTKEELGKSGISMGFGNTQYYAFNLAYHVKNNYIFPSQTEIALPPSTNYQTVVLDDISPKPKNVRKDKDGNWLAEYSLLPSEKLTVMVKGRVMVSLVPIPESLSSSQEQQYLAQKPFWEANTKIKELAKQLKTPDAMYAYVVENLTYDFSRVTGNSPRLGAKSVLDNPHSAVCLEFTDLFIALSRAAGIPARAIDGFAFTQNSKQRPVSKVMDILHTWPEYYDKALQTWIMVDPTWGNTTGGIDYFYTLDFDHVAFVIKGTSSDFPIPAGGYKTKEYESVKDVELTFIPPFEEEPPTINVSAVFPEENISGFTINGQMLIKNNSGVTIPSQEINIINPTFLPSEQKITTETIPPYGTLSIPLSFKSISFLTKSTSLITMHIGEHKLTKTVETIPIFKTIIGIIGGVTIAGCTIILLILIARTRHLPFSR